MDSQNNRPSGPPTPRSDARIVFIDLNGKTKAFEYLDHEQRQSSPYVTGYYRRHWTEWDEGRQDPNPKLCIEPRWKVRVEFESVEVQGRVFPRATVTVAPKGSAYGFVEQILQVEQNKFVGLTALPGDSTTFVDVSVHEGEVGWRPLYTPKNDGTDFDSRYDAAIKRLQESPLHQSPVRRAEGGEVQTSAQPNQGQAAQPTTPAQNAEPAVVPPNPLPTAFGLQAPRWPKTLQSPATKERLDLVAAKLKERGLEGLTAHGVVCAVLHAYGLPALKDRDTPLTGGQATLVYDWASNVDEKGISMAKDAGVIKTAPADEYDPFEDE